MSTTAEYRMKNVGDLRESGEVSDLLLADLIELAADDMQSATVQVSDEGVQVICLPHTLPEKRYRFDSIAEAVRDWIDDLWSRTANAEAGPWGSAERTRAVYELACEEVRQ